MHDSEITATVTNVDPYVRAIDTRVGDFVPAYLLSSHTVSQGTYDPGTKAGEELLAHELTHVVQQDGAATGGPLTVGPAGDHHEHEADSVAGALGSAASSGDLQRMEDDEMAGIQRQAMEEEEEELLE